MAQTLINSDGLASGCITRPKLNTTLAGSGVIAKVIEGAGISVTYTGVDAGTGDVTISLGSGLTYSATGNLSFATPSGGGAPIQATGADYTVAAMLNGAATAHGGALALQGNYSGAGVSPLLALSDANNTNGVNLLLTGNGATTPSKTLRVVNGSLALLNNAGTAISLLGDDGGMQLGAPTGGDKGPGTLNLAGCYYQQNLLVGGLILLQSAIPFVTASSGSTQNNGAVVLGQRPAATATATFSATSGTGITCTFSAATLVGSALDVGRVLTIFDTTYKYFTITGNSGSSTTVCQGTISGGTLSTVGAWANTALWLTGAPAAGTTGYSSPLPYVVGNSYSYFPTNAIYSGSTAGWYWTNWNSLTTGTVYNNTYTTGMPVIVASPTAFATTGPGAYTAQTGRVLGPNISMAGNLMGLNGSIESSIFLTCAKSSGNKGAAVAFAGNIIGTMGSTSTSTSGIGGMISLSNRGATNLQVSTAMSGVGAGDYTAGNVVPTVTTVDTTAAQIIGVSMGLLSLTTDVVILDRYSQKLYSSSP
jgi:hypothetical protein